MQVEIEFKKVPIESKQKHLEPYHKKPKLSNFVTTEFTLYQPCPNYKKLKIKIISGQFHLTCLTKCECEQVGM